MRQVGLSTPTLEWCVCAMWDDTSWKCLLKGEEKSGRNTQRDDWSFYETNGGGVLVLQCIIYTGELHIYGMTVGTGGAYFNQTFSLTWLQLRWLYFLIKSHACGFLNGLLILQCRCNYVRGSRSWIVFQKILRKPWCFQNIAMTSVANAIAPNC